MIHYFSVQLNHIHCPPRQQVQGLAAHSLAPFFDMSKTIQCAQVKKDQTLASCHSEIYCQVFPSKKWQKKNSSR